MNRTCWKLIVAAAGVVAGAAMLIAVLLCGDSLPGGVSGLLCGVGGGVLGLGASGLIIPLIMRSMSPEERKEVERGEHDERNVAIRTRAAQDSWYWSLYLLWIPFVVALVQNNILWMVLTSGVIVLHCTFYLVNMARWGRRM